MATATIVAKFINPPGPGKKMASIKTDKDDFYLIPPELAQSMQPGGTYDVEYKSNPFRGTTYKNIEKFSEAKAAAPNGGGVGTVGKYGKTDNATAERIYVCGILNAIMGNPNINPTNLTADYLISMTKAAREAWMETFGRHNDALNDELPY